MKRGSSSHRSSLPPAAAAPDAERTMFDWPRHTGTTGAVLQELEEQLRLRRRRRRRMRSVAGMLVLLLAGGWMWQRQGPSGAASSVVATATASVPTRQLLPDGSVVLLRTGAELRVDFSEEVRRVHIDRGEALFDVLGNPARPFVVRAGGLDVRAVGTSFAVNLRASAVEVIVTEGQVAVEKPAVASPAPGSPMADMVPAPSAAGVVSGHTLVLIPAGHRAVVENTAHPLPPELMAVSELEMTERLGWRIPKLHFHRTPLRDAIMMINQYSRVRLVLDGTTLEEVPLSGVIRADNIHVLLELLESDYGIQAEDLGETEIVLRKSP